LGEIPTQLGNLVLVRL